MWPGGSQGPEEPTTMEAARANCPSSLAVRLLFDAR